jgi:hypothetical protein
MAKKQNEEYTPEETAKRAEEAIRRSFATPHKQCGSTRMRQNLVARAPFDASWLRIVEGKREPLAVATFDVLPRVEF